MSKTDHLQQIIKQRLTALLAFHFQHFKIIGKHEANNELFAPIQVKTIHKVQKYHI